MLKSTGPQRNLKRVIFTASLNETSWSSLQNIMWELLFLHPIYVVFLFMQVCVQHMLWRHASVQVASMKLDI
jgi:hypothetical protein